MRKKYEEVQREYREQEKKHVATCPGKRWTIRTREGHTIDNTRIDTARDQDLRLNIKAFKACGR